MQTMLSWDFGFWVMFTFRWKKIRKSSTIIFVEVVL